MHVTWDGIIRHQQSHSHRAVLQRKWKLSTKEWWKTNTSKSWCTCGFFSVFRRISIILLWLSIDHDFLSYIFLFFSFYLVDPHFFHQIWNVDVLFLFFNWLFNLIFPMYLTFQHLTLISIFTFLGSIRILEYFHFNSPSCIFPHHSSEHCYKVFHEYLVL